MKSFFLALGIIFFHFEPQAYSQVSNASWQCQEPQWAKDPEMFEGIFRARIRTECQVFSQKPEAISWLFQKLQNEFQRKEKYQIHEGPLRSQEGLFTHLQYDLTDRLSEEDSDLAIRQNVYLKTDEKNILDYLTQSKEIQASGTASYLKQVSFLTEVIAKKDFYLVKLENEVEIERPWFALSFLFKPMSASITKDKFEKARDKLMQYLLAEKSL